MLSDFFMITINEQQKQKNWKIDWIEIIYAQNSSLLFLLAATLKLSNGI